MNKIGFFFMFTCEYVAYPLILFWSTNFDQKKNFSKTTAILKGKRESRMKLE